MRIYSLTEMVEEALKIVHASIAFMEKIIIESASGILENLFFTCRELVNNISVNKD